MTTVKKNTPTTIPASTPATKTAAEKQKPSPLFEVKTLPVLRGDVFGQGSSDGYDLVVIEAGPEHCQVRRTQDGKRSRIQTTRLQREYSRRGEVATKRAHKAITVFIAKEAKTTSKKKAA